MGEEKGRGGLKFFDNSVAGWVLGSGGESAPVPPTRPAGRRLAGYVAAASIEAARGGL